MSAPQIQYPPTSGGGTPVGGSGTTNTIPVWTGATTLGDSPLTVSGSNVTGAGAIRATGTTAGAPAFTGADTDTGVYFPAANQMRFSTAGSLAISIDASQNVGIGVIPSAWASSVRAEEMRTHARWNYNSGSDSVAYWTVNAFLNSAGNPIYKATAAASQYTQIGGAHVWERAVSGTAGNTVTWLESARIDSSGNVGIGTASPGTKLDVADTGTPSGTVGIRSLYTGTITANAGGVLALGGYFTGTSPTTFAYIVGGKDNAIAGDFGGHIQFITRPNGGVYTERARIDSAGNLILNTANTGATIQAAGSQQGLKLPATPGNTDPNTLDCYADGGTANSGGVTWTPALRFGGATTGITGSQVGRYTRIGNMVFAQGTIALSSKGSATGAASIAGLPTSANVAATIYYSIAIGYNSKVTFTGQLHGLISVNSGIVELYQTSTAGVVSAITNTDFAADSVLTFTVCYPVT